MTITKDEFFVARGGYAQILQLNCLECGKKLGTYQKDGPGTINRLYFDRCQKNLLKNMPEYRGNRRWDCPYCGRYLAFAALYKKENRRAWYLLIDRIKFTPL